MKVLLNIVALICSIMSFTHVAQCEKPVPMSMSMSSGMMSDQEPDKTSSRNYGAYGNSADSSNQYYATYTGYPSSYGPQTSTNSDQFNPSDYYPYYGQTVEKKKPSPPPPTYPTYPTNFYPSGYGAGYGAGYGSIECTEQMMGGVINDVLTNTGANGFGILRPIVGAITAAILAKIPIIIAIKALIVKAILLPLGFIILSLPIILPIVLLFFPWFSKIRDTFVGTTTPAPAMMVMVPAANNTNTAGAKARTMDQGQDIFRAVLESDRCFEKLACSLGSRDANTPFIQPISWLLKFLQSFKFVQKNTQIRSTLKRYRDAYLQGVTATTKFISETNSTTTDTEEFCNDQLYPCSTSTLYARPEFVGFSRYL